jgi:endoglucanase
VSNVTFFVDPDSNARRQAAEWEVTRPDDAKLMRKIAEHAQADWFGDWTTDPRAEIAARLTQEVAAGALPVIVLYSIPYRDCGLYSKGGANDSEAYRAWIEEVAAGIGESPAVIILEPDAIAGMGCLNDAQADERLELIAWAVDTLMARPGVDVYIDAGNVNWHPAPEVAGRLKRAGIGRATGFALNVSNFYSTEQTTAYGHQISDALNLGGTHFVVDTSRNGNGVWESDDPETWCNPPGRALGEPTTVDTGDPLVDAWLWIKSPGESDGECRGAPAAGVWYPEYALELAKNARW